MLTFGAREGAPIGCVWFDSPACEEPPADATHSEGVRKKGHLMAYGIGGILITILVILAIIYFAKRV